MSDLAASRIAARPMAVTDPLIMTARCFRLSRRQIDALLTSLLLPVMLKVVFVYLFGNVARNIVSTVLVFGVAFGIGFRPHAGLAAWLAVAGLLVLFVAAISWLCAAWGLIAGSAEAASGCMFLLMFVTYASSAFVPIRTMPGWLHGFAAHQPATPVIETLRGLLLHTPVGSSWWQAVAWCSGIMAVSVLGCAVLFGRRTR